LIQNLPITKSRNAYQSIKASPAYQSIPRKCASTGPVLGQYWSDAGSIGPVPALYWHVMACLQGHYTKAKIYICEVIWNPNVFCSELQYFPSFQLNINMATIKHSIYKTTFNLESECNALLEVATFLVHSNLGAMSVVYGSTFYMHAHTPIIRVVVG